MRTFAKRAVSRAAGLMARAMREDAAVERGGVLVGKIAARQLQAVSRIERLSDIEFGVSSQWGEDGILEWLIQRLGNVPPSFIEFGVENYLESNTRFLLQNRNWRGLVIDGSEKHIEYIRKDPISWRHEINATCRFITSENINEIILESGFSGDIGVLSIDIDGNDYWVWRAIEAVNPIIVIVEYNSVFGDLHPITIPYRDNFYRTAAHFSNLYFGASVGALERLGANRGYRLMGCNGAGSNLFFVRDDRAEALLGMVADRSVYPSRVRESRARDGALSLISGVDRAAVIDDLPMQDIASGDVKPLRDFPDLFSEKWRRYLQGELVSA